MFDIGDSFRPYEMNDKHENTTHFPHQHDIQSCHIVLQVYDTF